MKHVYTSWFKDLSFDDDDPEAEWPACFIIEGEDVKQCKAWGDTLSKSYATRSSQIFLRSNMESIEDCTLTEIRSMPVVKEGEMASDRDIGW
jgi:hypothetical protein